MKQRLAFKATKLTTKQKNFVVEYQKDWNAARAAREVGYSPKSAKRIGYRLVHQSPLLQAALKEDIQERLERKGHRADHALDKLLNVINFDFRKLFNPDGSFKKPHEVDDETAGSIAGLEVIELFEGKGEGRTAIGHLKKVRTNDRVKAIELLMKSLKLLGPENQNTTNVIILKAGPVIKPFNAGMSEE